MNVKENMMKLLLDEPLITDDLKIELDQLLCEVSGIFDGWHSDGTYWTEYDESVRKKIDEFRKKYTYLTHLKNP